MRLSAFVPVPAVLAACFVVPSCLRAQAPAPGIVAGRVVDTAGAGVSSVIVFVRGTRFGTTTDGTGFYRIPAVPAGDYTLVVRRVGFATDSAAVHVAAAITTTRDVRLRPLAASLAGVVVRASPRLSETREAAIARRAEAPNIVTTLSGDEIRALPNANAAEAAARMPGVSTERDEGEGKFVQVRGTEPRLSNVTIDGAHVPGTEAGNRIPKLDAIPSDLLGAVEISKTLTADMDADAIGGSVNLVTKRAEGPPRGYVALQGGQQSQLSAKQGQVSATYGGRFGAEERLGVLVGGSYDRNNRSIQDLEGAWNADGSRVFPVEWDHRDYVYGRTRAGGGGSVDYHFAGGSTVYLRGLYTDFRNFGTRYRYDIATGGDSTSLANGLQGVGTGAQFTREVSNRTPIERLFGFTAGGRIPVGRLELDYAGNFSGTRQSISNYRFNDFTYNGPDGNGVPLLYNGSNLDLPRYRYASTADSLAAMNASNYALSGYSLSSGLSTGRDDGGQVNALVRYTLGGGNAGTLPSTFKFGAKIRDEHKSYVNNGQRYSYSGDSASAPTVAQVESSFRDPNYYGAVASGFALGPSPAVGAIEHFEDAHPGLFTNTTNVVRNQINSYSGGETVYSGYGMNTTDVGALRVNLGLRLEATHSTFSGNVASRPQLANGNPGPYVVTSVPGTQNYVDLFPSAQFRYALDPRSNVRLAVTRAIARPNYIDLAPHLQGEVCAACGTNFNNLTTGNPDLKPQHAWNYDLLGEHFFPGAGVLSGGVFYKQISDFIYLRNFVYQGPVTDFQGYYGRRPENGGNGHLAGFEFQYTQRFLTLPGAFAGLGVDLNWTHIESRVALLGDTATTAATLGHPVVTRSAQLARQSPNLANLGLTYDLGRVSARASYQYQGASIYSYGDGTPTPNGDTYLYAHGQVDASIIANVTPLVSLQLQGLNLNNEIFGFYQGSPGMPYAVQRETYGRSFILGVKYGFGGR